MTEWYVSNKRFTCLVIVENDIIVGGAPIIRKFIGQKFDNLIRWMEKQGGFKKYLLQKD